MSIILLFSFLLSASARPEGGRKESTLAMSMMPDLRAYGEGLRVLGFIVFIHIYIYIYIERERDIYSPCP